MASNTGPAIFTPATITKSNMMAEKVLNNSALSGSITLPVFLQDSTGADKTGETNNTPNNMTATIYTIPFLLESDFSLSLGNTWDTMVPGAATDFIDMMAALGGFANLSGNGEAQMSWISKTMQTAVWKGSQQPKFSISATFLCTQRNYNPVNIIKALSETCLPRNLDEKHNPTAVKVLNSVSTSVRNIGNTISEKTGMEGLKTLTDTTADAIAHSGISAPLYYAPSVDHTTGSTEIAQSCTVAIQIGNWFRADELIVDSLSGITFSKEMIAPAPKYKIAFNGDSSKSGFPLYAKCTIELRPYKYITAEDFMKYFIIH